MEIKVTKKHILAGRPCYCKRCPIALALKDAKIHKANLIFVGNRRIWIGETPFYELPKKAVNFIERFDAGKSVKPFEFVLRPL
jgi:hypothetical protein